MRKVIFFVMIALMFLPAAVFASGEQDGGSSPTATVNAAGTFPIVDETVTLTFFCTENPEYTGYPYK